MCGKPAPTKSALSSRHRLTERVHRSRLVRHDVENGIELGHLHYVGDFVRYVEKFQLSALFARADQGADERAEAHTVYVIDAGEIEQNVFMPLAEQARDDIAHRSALAAKYNPPGNVQNGDGAELPRVGGH